MICSSCRSALRLRLLSSLPARPSIAPTITSSFKQHAKASPQRSIRSAPIRQFSSSTPFSSSQQPQQETETETDADEETGMTAAESSIAAILASKLNPTALLVQDISGGCGSMYAIDITSSAFKGLNMLKQQRLVNAALGNLVKEWHGVQIRTRVPAEDA
ncbi:bola protein [Trichoderma austrokoningii]